MAPVINYQSDSELIHVKGDRVCLRKNKKNKNRMVTHIFVIHNGTVKAVYM